ncbi:hypothetical protein N665_0123s0018 [Sinapis alba]|nr:hypothetical protein N665_0123s0018 [Sinapis alba]
MSHKLQSRASKQCLFIIGASSQLIREALANNSALSLPGRNNEAIPLEATFSTISPLSQTATDRMFH